MILLTSFYELHLSYQFIVKALMFNRDNFGVLNRAYYKVPRVVNKRERLRECDVEHLVKVVFGVELVTRRKQGNSCKDLRAQRVYRNVVYQYVVQESYAQVRVIAGEVSEDRLIFIP